MLTFYLGCQRWFWVHFRPRRVPTFEVTGLGRGVDLDACFVWVFLLLDKRMKIRRAIPLGSNKLMKKKCDESGCPAQKKDHQLNTEQFRKAIWWHPGHIENRQRWLQKNVAVMQRNGTGRLETTQSIVATDKLQRDEQGEGVCVIRLIVWQLGPGFAVRKCRRKDRKRSKQLRLLQQNRRSSGRAVSTYDNSSSS